MTIRIATLAGHPEWEASLASEVTYLHGVELSLRCVDKVEALAAVRAGDVDAIVAVGAPGWFDTQVAAEARASNIGLVGLADNALEEERLRSLGVELVDESAPAEDIVRACRVPVGNVPPEIVRPIPRPRPPGRLVAIWGPKGSPGRTSLSVELSAVLAESNPQVILVDADPYGGDIAQVLGFTEELPTVMWAAGLAAKEDLGAEELLDGLRRVGDEGPLVLPGVPRAELWAEVSDFGWRELLSLLRSRFAYSVLDVGFCLEPESSPYPGSGEGRNRMTRATLQEADRVVAVCRADPIGLKNFIWAFQELGELVDLDAVTIILNRVGSGQRAERDELLLRHLGRRSAVAIPERIAEFGRAVAEGRSVHELKPSSDVGHGIRELAAQLGGRVRTRGLLARLGGKRA